MAASCFPKDVSALKQLAGNSGYHFQLLSSVIEVNELQKRRTIGKLQKHLGSLVGQARSRCSASRSSRTPTTSARRPRWCSRTACIGEGAHVRVYDPVALDRARARCSAARRPARAREEALDGADAAVLVTEWPEFRELDWAGDVKDLMRDAAGRRRPELPRRRGAARRRLHLRGHRPARGVGGRGLTRAGARPRRWRGHAAAAAHADHAEAGDAVRRPAVHDVHARLARDATASTT